jgi:hypothetical protein
MAASYHIPPVSAERPCPLLHWRRSRRDQASCYRPTGEAIRFSFKTIERWWYIARGVDDPLAALARKIPGHAGTHPSLGPALAEAIAAQHRDHPRWSWQLHHDNLLALAREDPRLGPVPGYATVCRFMKGRV